MKRYGIYYAPPRDSALGRFGTSWLGWDAELGVEMRHPSAPPLSDELIAEITTTPRRYGFHGTLKPPLTLSPGNDLAGLRESIIEFAARESRFVLEGLHLRCLGRFLALVPVGPVDKLASLAGKVVRVFDSYRMPPSDQELAYRRRAGLSDRQERMLLEWGYPYVMEEFRFHLTLSGTLDEGTRDIAMAALIPLTERFREMPLEISDLSLFEDPGDGQPFRLIERFPLAR